MAGWSDGGGRLGCGAGCMPWRKVSNPSHRPWRGRRVVFLVCWAQPVITGPDWPQMTPHGLSPIQKQITTDFSDDADGNQPTEILSQSVESVSSVVTNARDDGCRFGLFAPFFVFSAI
jgi:hypothetical protein